MVPQCFGEELTLAPTRNLDTYVKGSLATFVMRSKYSSQIILATLKWSNVFSSFHPNIQKCSRPNLNTDLPVRGIQITILGKKKLIHPATWLQWVHESQIMASLQRWNVRRYLFCCISLHVLLSVLSLHCDVVVLFLWKCCKNNIWIIIASSEPQ